MPYMTMPDGTIERFPCQGYEECSSSCRCGSRMRLLSQQETKDLGLTMTWVYDRGNGGYQPWETVKTGDNYPFVFSNFGNGWCACPGYSPGMPFDEKRLPSKREALRYIEECLR
jgi:hypothetical protein